MPREQLLSNWRDLPKRKDLPSFVDSLTPDGRLPSQDEAGQWV
jgi:uncharacterized protein YidB (DUF937 family)